MKLLSGLNRLLYWPICRAYAKFVVGDRPSDPIQRYLCSFQFWQTHRYWPRFVHSRRFSEKIWRLMLFERDPLLTQISDKLRVRDYVAKKTGNNFLIPLLWHGEKPDRIPIDRLPDKFIIKANHGCGYNLIVTSKAKLDVNKTKLQVSKWLKENFCTDKYLGTEWGYKHIKPAILIESLIEEDGEAPKDYKFWCFSGRAEYISIHFDRFTKHSYQSFNRDFEPIDLTFGIDIPKYGGRIEKPANLKLMLDIADSLAEGFGFVRVDLYNPSSRIYFGELTLYPAGGLIRIHPESWDHILGEKWRSPQETRVMGHR